MCLLQHRTVIHMLALWHASSSKPTNETTVHQISSLHSSYPSGEYYLGGRLCEQSRAESSVLWRAGQCLLRWTSSSLDHSGHVGVGRWRQYSVCVGRRATMALNGRTTRAHFLRLLCLDYFFNFAFHSVRLFAHC